MKRSNFLIASAVLIILVYLWVSAPPPLEAASEQERRIPVEALFRLVAAENDFVRELYTKEIVGAGKKVGLGFGEQWKQAGVDHGPLPALFLREAAGHLERSPVELGLFLGSDFPINSANRFGGSQRQYFDRIKQSREPAFFYDDETDRHTAMFVDLAVAPACVRCHNEHKDTPKSDWKLDDVMGATTWTYPRDTVSADELLTVLAATRDAFRSTYESYLDKSRSFEQVPALGSNWPKEGSYCLPDLDAFMSEHASRASSRAVNQLIRASDPAQ